MDALPSRACPQEVLRRHDRQLRRIFAWYCTLEETDPRRTGWEHVRSRGLTMGRTEFMLMLLNFQVRAGSVSLYVF
jgi:hypothetical protein